MSLLQYFESGFKPTNQQTKILNKIEESLNKKTKFIIVSAPTGSGKSFITKTLANYCNDIDPTLIELIKSKKLDEIKINKCIPGGCFGLTITKNLQDQYLQFFHDAKVFKGKNNYNCILNDKLTCEVGACAGLNNIKRGCIIKNQCPYYNAMQDVLINKFGVLNYASFFKLQKHFKRRQIIVCDEASELEDELVSNFTLDITYKTLRYFDINVPKLSIDASSLKIKNWIDSLSTEVITELEYVESILKDSESIALKLSSKNITKYRFLQNLNNTLSDIINLWEDCEFVLDGDDEHIILMPLYVNKLASFIFNYADTIILTSATIVDHKKFAETLGIEKYDYIEGDNMFDPNKAPIFIAKDNNINYSNLDSKLPKLLNQIIKICDRHKNDKGILHTHTNKITNYIQSNYDTDRLTVRCGNITNEEVLKIHKEKNNSIIVSPSMTYGVDLKDDLARFQIIVKLPYLPLHNKRVAKLTKIDQNWYIMKMINNLIQACGRGIRTQNDWCYTYIMDSNLLRIIERYKYMLPKYFLDRFV